MRDQSESLKSSRYWFMRAEELQVLADSFRNKAIREKMLLVAEDYRRIAIQAAEREAARSAGTKEKEKL